MTFVIALEYLKNLRKGVGSSCLPPMRSKQSEKTKQNNNIELCSEIKGCVAIATEGSVCPLGKPSWGLSLGISKNK